MLFHLTKSRQSLSDSTIRLESFEVQGKTNLLDATRVSEQKENIFSTFIKYGEKKKLTLIVTHWTNAWIPSKGVLK